MKSYVNKISLRDLFEEFSIEDIVSALNSHSVNTEMENTKSTDYELSVENELMQPEEAILNFIKRIEGIRINLKEIHWNTTKTKTHNIANDFMYILDTLQDEIAEDMQGFFKYRIKIGDLTPIESHLLTIEDIINDILGNTITLKASILNTKGLDGIVSLLDNFMHQVNKLGYLENMEY